MNVELCRVNNLSIDIDNTNILRNISFSLFQGELLGLFGLHGSGKTLLAKAISGFISLPKNTIEFNKSIFSCKSFGNKWPKQQELFYISKTSMLIPDLTIYENMLAIKNLHISNIMFNEKLAIICTQKLLDEANINISASQLASELSDQQKHILQILKGISLGAKIIILDDITNEYCLNDYQNLLTCIKQYPSVSFVFITNKLNILLKNLDRIAIMRSGRIAGFIYKNEYSAQKLMRYAAATLEENLFTCTPSMEEKEVFSVSNINIDNRKYSFAINKGEIFGIFEPDISKHNDILRHFIDPRIADMEIDKRKPKNYRQAIKYGMALIPENYSKTEHFGDFDFYDNLTFQTLPIASHFGFINKKLINYIKKNYDDKFTEEEKRIKNRINGLKTVLYRWIATNPKIMILENLTVGLDIVIKQKVFSIINEAVQDGISVLIVSSDIYEVCTLCTRILFTNANGTKNIFSRDELTLQDYINSIGVKYDITL